MTDRMRESLFMSLSLRVPLAGTRIADLFAGSGAVALEALSRGAAAALLCDTDRHVIAHLRHALPSPVYRDKQLHIYHQRAESVLRHATERCDIIFLDPPYAYPGHDRLLGLVCASALCGAESVVVLHYRHPTELSPSAHGLTSLWRRRFGTSVVEVWRTPRGTPA